MKNVAILVLTLITISILSLTFTSCGQETYKSNTIQVPGPKGDTGLIGATGSSGQNGTNGLSVVFTSITATAAQCVNGGYVLLVGQDANLDGVLDAGDSDIQSMVVCNGLNGSNGATGPQGPQGIQGNAAPVPSFTPVSEIEPCGAASSPYKEVLLCLSGGSILGSFSDNANGLNTRFANLPSGSYQDTDQSGCNFNVSVASNGSSTVSWSAGSNSFSNWIANSIVCTAN